MVIPYGKEFIWIPAVQIIEFTTCANLMAWNAKAELEHAHMVAEIYGRVATLPFSSNTSKELDMELAKFREEQHA